MRLAPFGTCPAPGPFNPEQDQAQVAEKLCAQKYLRRIGLNRHACQNPNVFLGLDLDRASQLLLNCPDPCKLYLIHFHHASRLLSLWHREPLRQSKGWVHIHGPDFPIISGSVKAPGAVPPLFHAAAASLGAPQHILCIRSVSASPIFLPGLRTDGFFAAFLYLLLYQSAPSFRNELLVQ